MLIIHCSIVYVAGLACFVLSNKPPLIVSLMGIDTQGNYLKLKLIQIFSRFFWSHTIIKSKSMAKSVHFNNLVVLPNGINLEEIKEIQQKGIIKYYSLPIQKGFLRTFHWQRAHLKHSEI